jgi:hypothetical protein
MKPAIWQISHKIANKNPKGYTPTFLTGRSTSSMNALLDIDSGKSSSFQMIFIFISWIIMSPFIT